MANQNRMLGYAANMPMETWTPDVWGQNGMATQAGQIAAINAFKSKELEQKTNPALAAMRQSLPSMIQEDLSPNNWQKHMDQWAKHAGLAKMLGSGAGDSTFSRSALFDAGTLEGQAMKRANLEQAQRYLAQNQAPVAGLDPGSIIGAQQAAQAQGMQQRAGFRDALMGRAQGAAQSTTDWINQMMSSTNQAAESNKRDWQNYQQAMLQGAQNNANQTNALIGAGIGAAGQFGGGYLAGR